MLLRIYNNDTGKRAIRGYEKQRLMNECNSDGPIRFDKNKLDLVNYRLILLIPSNIQRYYTCYDL